LVLPRQERHLPHVCEFQIEAAKVLCVLRFRAPRSLHPSGVRTLYLVRFRLSRASQVFVAHAFGADSQASCDGTRGRSGTARARDHADTFGTANGRSWSFGNRVRGSHGLSGTLSSWCVAHTKVSAWSSLRPCRLASVLVVRRRGCDISDRLRDLRVSGRTTPHTSVDVLGVSSCRFFEKK
jgi:hypothetical protein